MTDKVLHKNLSYIICGLCFKVHNEFGSFMNEKVYADFLEKLLIDANLSYVREQPLPEQFATELPRRSIPDFVIDNKVVLDTKAKRVVSELITIR